MGAVDSPLLLRREDAALSDNSLLPSSLQFNCVGDGISLTSARSGDHFAIHDFLMGVFRKPSLREFQSQLEEPGYSPAQRLIIKQGKHLVAHARVAFRKMRLGIATLPIARLFDLATHPDHRGHGYASQLLAAGENFARQQGAVLMLARSAKASLFRRQHWYPCGRHSYSFAAPRNILAEFDRRREEDARVHPRLPELPGDLSQTPITVRRWKQTEYPAIQRLYDQFAEHNWGAEARNDERWRWLIAREAYDWLYVAVEGNERSQLDDGQRHIVGYALVKGGRIVEMIASPLRQDAAEALVMRACRDAIECDHGTLRLDAPATHPLHQVIASSGGRTIHAECDGGQWLLGKTLDLPKLVSATLNDAPQDVMLSIDVRDAGTTDSFSASVGHERLIVESGRARVDRSLARSQASGTCAAITQVFLGHMSLTQAAERESIRLSNDSARDDFEKLTRPGKLWFPPFEDLLAT